MLHRESPNQAVFYPFSSRYVARRNSYWGLERLPMFGP